jgi:hypothetical protein
MENGCRARGGRAPTEREHTGGRRRREKALRSLPPSHRAPSLAGPRRRTRRLCVGGQVNWPRGTVHISSLSTHQSCISARYDNMSQEGYRRARVWMLGCCEVTRHAACKASTTSLWLPQRLSLTIFPFGRRFLRAFASKFIFCPLFFPDSDPVVVLCIFQVIITGAILHAVAECMK